MARPAASDVSFTVLGLISFQADLMPLTESTAKEISFKLVCPECAEPTKVDQKYLCPNEHGPFVTGDCGRAKEVGKALVKVTDEDIKALKEPTLPAKEMSISVFPAAQVDASTRPSGAAYRLRAEKNLPVVAMVAALVADGEFAFVGEMNLGRSGQKLYRLATWRGELVAEELARPDEVVEFAATAVAYEPKVLDQAKQLAALQVGDFDPVQFRNLVRERAAALDEALLSGAPTATVATLSPAKDPVVDLMAALEASIAAAKAA